MAEFYRLILIEEFTFLRLAHSTRIYVYSYVVLLASIIVCMVVLVRIEKER